MDAKVEITKMLKDLQSSAREFAAMGLSVGTKALKFAGANLKSLEENLEKTAEKLKKDVEPAAAEAPVAETAKSEPAKS